MKCDEVQTMQAPYLDSELDAKTSLEIEQHLKTCPGCARLFAEEEKLEARMMAGLNRGPRTVALWARIEGEVAAAAHVPQPDGWQGVLGTLGGRLQAGWQPTRWVWAGLAGVWVVILALNFAARQADAPLAAGREVPSASEMRLALKEKQLLMAELAITSEPAPADKSKAAPPSPRSDRRNENLNT
jgi:anti-sigma factor RsiW